MIKDNFELKYFTSRNIYQSTKTNQKSHSLTDFATSHFRLNSNILKNTFNNNKNGKAYFQSYKFDPDFEWVLGVHRLKSLSQLEINEVDNWKFYLDSLEKILVEQLVDYKNSRNLLLLSGGIDSQLILSLCLANNIAFKAIHITSNIQNTETQYILAQSKQKKYDLDIIHTDSFSHNKFVETVDRYSKINPAYSFTFWTDLALTYALSLPQYSDYDYVLSGFRAETILTQVPEGTCDIADHSLELDQQYGTYIKYNQNFETTWDFKKRYSNYENWSNLYLKGIGVPSRNLYSLEKISNKTMIYPYLSKQLHELALGLVMDLKIKNVYKFTQIELLDLHNWEYSLKKNEIENTISYKHMFKPDLELRQRCISTWMKNYINISKSAGV